MSTKGYKVFNPDWTCRRFQYEVGKTYKHNGNIEMCGSGFHFCRNLSDCFSYYDFSPNNRVAEVEAIGNVETRDNKSVTDEIIIKRELTWDEVLRLWNTGNRNTGDRNTGDWNSCNYSAGFFCSKNEKVILFNKNTELSREEIYNIKGIKILNWNYENKWWIYSDNMTEAEKTEHPEHTTTGGYLKSIPFKDACVMMWSKLTDDEKEAVKEIENFDAKIFYDITGIEV